MTLDQLNHIANQTNQTKKFHKDNSFLHIKYLLTKKCISGQYQRNAPVSYLSIRRDYVISEENAPGWQPILG